MPSSPRPDVWGFDEAARKCEWERAVERYAGPVLDGVHLMDGVEFESWLERERSVREQECHAALERLAAAATEAGEPAAAARWWRRRAAADPFSARVALGLMRALADAGDAAGALKHARIHQQLVRDSPVSTAVTPPRRRSSAWAQSPPSSPWS